ncbi:hypothetical protein DRO24_03530 [Candidatus Bathyarchaeota archaeon]|mgnify:CR=1 FL=1|nr:MAG: hypothetical protein DRO24_03530 [Candidatus Bathyarchaeota archaeon]
MPYANTYETVQVEVVGAPPTAFTVSIYVYDLNTRSPIADASITFDSTTVSTNTSGFAQITDVPAGSYTLSVSKDGYEDYSRTVEVNQDLIIEVYLTPKQVPEKARVEIRVRLFGFISVPYVKLTINGEEVKADSSGVAVVYLDKGVEYLLKAEHWLIDTLEQTIGPFTYDTSIDVYALPSLLLWLLITGGVSGITYLASGSKRATIVIGVATFIMWPAMKYLPELVKTKS